MALAMGALQMVTRIRDHIERLDDGHPYAADDLAVVLRALVCPSQGNDVLRRMYKSFQLSIPKTTVSKPARADAGVFFSVGAIPVEGQRAVEDGAAVLPFESWMESPVLRVTSSGSRVTYSWTQFLNTYANKWGGAHLDPAVPAHLQMIDHHVASGMPLSNYLLRSAAVRTWELGQRAFRLILKDLEPPGMTSEEINARSRHWSANPDEVFIAAESGNASQPRDISSKGLLQHFSHSSDEAEVLMYVDERSPDNALRLALGTRFYDIRYEHPEVPSTKGPLEVSAQRKTLVPAADPAGGKTIQMNGRFRTLAEVRSPLVAEDIP